jgi:hypothetical protein
MPADGCHASPDRLKNQRALASIPSGNRGGGHRVQLPPFNQFVVQSNRYGIGPRKDGPNRTSSTSTLPDMCQPSIHGSTVFGCRVPTTISSASWMIQSLSIARAGREIASRHAKNTHQRILLQTPRFMHLFPECLLIPSSQEALPCAHARTGSSASSPCGYSPRSG